MKERQTMTGILDFVLEQKDETGKWHTIWSNKMLETQWYASRYGEPFDLDRNDAVHHMLRNLNINDHNVQDALFAKLIANQLHENGLGRKTGIATAGHPRNISACLSHIITRNPESVSKGYAYTLTLADIQNIQRRVSDLKPQNIIANEQKKGLHLWAQNALKAIHFIQTDFLNQIIGQLPDGDDVYNTDFQLHTSNSAHQSLAIANGGKWDTLLPGGDNTRLIFFRDDTWPW